MMFGLFNLIKQVNFKPNTKILAVHTGGLQEIKVFNKRFENKYNIEF